MPYTLNKAEREKDASKVESLGPFAFSLSMISLLAYFKILKDNRKFDSVYRGVRLHSKIFDEYKVDKEIELRGFLNTSLNKEIAYSYMFKGLKKDEVPVLFQIDNINEIPYFNNFILDNSEYSLFTYEQEVLVCYFGYRKY